MYHLLLELLSVLSCSVWTWEYLLVIGPFKFETVLLCLNQPELAFWHVSQLCQHVESFVSVPRMLAAYLEFFLTDGFRNFVGHIQCSGLVYFIFLVLRWLLENNISGVINAWCVAFCQTIRSLFSMYSLSSLVCITPVQVFSAKERIMRVCRRLAFTVELAKYSNGSFQWRVSIWFLGDHRTYVCKPIEVGLCCLVSSTSACYQYFYMRIWWYCDMATVLACKVLITESSLNKIAFTSNYVLTVWIEKRWFPGNDHNCPEMPKDDFPSWLECFANGIINRRHSLQFAFRKIFDHFKPSTVRNSAMWMNRVAPPSISHSYVVHCSQRHFSYQFNRNLSNRKRILVSTRPGLGSVYSGSTKVTTKFHLTEIRTQKWYVGMRKIDGTCCRPSSSRSVEV